eukprot:4497553-Prymnesium_polylepis.2
MIVRVCYGPRPTGGTSERARQARGRGTRRGPRATDTAGPRAVEYTHIRRVCVYNGLRGRTRHTNMARVRDDARTCVCVTGRRDEARGRGT